MTPNEIGQFTVFSGADTTVVAYRDSNTPAAQFRLDYLEKEKNEAERSRVSDPTAENAQTLMAINKEIARVKELKYYILGSMHTLSYSSFREKFAVRGLGQVAAKTYCLSESAYSLVRGKGRISIKDIQVGDYIHSSAGCHSKVTGKYPQGLKECFQLKLGHGYEIEATADHPIMTDDGWKKVSEITEEDKVAICLDYPINENRIDISDDLIKLAAYLIGDGSLHTYPKKESDSREHRISLSIADTEMETIGTEVSEILNRLDVDYVDHRNNNQKSIERRINICLKGYGATDWRLRKYSDLHKILLDYGLYDTYSHTKFIPIQLMQGMDLKQIALFLSRLFAADGCYCVCGEGDKYIEAKYCSTSERLVDEIRLLLAMFGISCLKSKNLKEDRCSKLVTATHDSYNLVISEAKSLIKFIEEISIFSKQYKVQHLLPTLYRRIKYDFLPISMRDFRSKVAEILRRKGLFRNKEYGISDLSYRFALSNYGLGLTPRRAFAVADELQDAELLSFVQEQTKELIYKKNDYEYLSFIEKVSIGEREVFDLSVEIDETFISNHILVKNCRGPRTVAGTMIFNTIQEQELLQLATSMDQERAQYKAVMLDQVEPFNLMILLANEYGSYSAMHLFNVEVGSEGESLSIDEAITRNAMNYYATDFIPPVAIGTGFHSYNDMINGQIHKVISQSAFNLDRRIPSKPKIDNQGFNPFDPMGDFVVDLLTQSRGLF